MKEYLWTLDGGRLQYQSVYDNAEINWLFLPGGPGLGSEALMDLTLLLKDKIPGVIWHFDLPNDGSNLLQGKSLSNWRSAIIQATKAFEKVILVAHSTPGMYVQTMPELENILHGLVLMGSAPDSSWQKTFANYCKKNADADILKAEKEYAKNPDNESLRQLLIAAAKYCFINEKSLIKGRELSKKIPVNHESNKWSEENFDTENYKATWVPQKIPALIMSGSDDHITSLDLFRKNKNYQRANILLKEISVAGHYPWFENPEEVVRGFRDYFEHYS